MSGHSEFPQGAFTVTYYARCMAKHNTRSGHKAQDRPCPVCAHCLADHNSEGRCDVCRPHLPRSTDG